MLFLINTFLGFLIAQIYDILFREKSESNPEKFDLVFFLKDTYQKIVLSLFLSLSISILIYLNDWDIISIFGEKIDFLKNMEYALIGFAPELVLQWVRKKYGVLQSKR